MLKIVLLGKLIREDADMITMQEGEGVAMYSKRFYRLPIDRDAIIPTYEVPWISEACDADVAATVRWMLPHLTVGDAIASYAAYRQARAEPVSI